MHCMYREKVIQQLAGIIEQVMLLDFFLFKVVRVTPKTCCWPANGREHGFQLLRCQEGGELLCMS